MDGLTLLREARQAGLEVLVAGDRLVIRGPKRLEPLAKRLLAEKPEVLAVLRGCPTCGATAEELETARRRRALDEALATCERHLATCRTCRGWGGPYCGDMERLREWHYQAWQAYYGIPAGEWDPWRS